MAPKKSPSITATGSRAKASVRSSTCGTGSTNVDATPKVRSSTSAVDAAPKANAGGSEEAVKQPPSGSRSSTRIAAQGQVKTNRNSTRTDSEVVPAGQIYGTQKLVQKLSTLRADVDPEEVAREMARLLKERDDLRVKAAQMNDQMVENNNMLELLSKKEATRKRLAKEVDEADERVQKLHNAEEEKRKQVKEQEERIAELQRKLELVRIQPIEEDGGPSPSGSLIKMQQPSRKASMQPIRKHSMLPSALGFKPRDGVRKMSLFAGGAKDFIKRRLTVTQPLPGGAMQDLQPFTVPQARDSQSSQNSRALRNSGHSEGTEGTGVCFAEAGEVFLIPGQVQQMQKELRVSHESDASDKSNISQAINELAAGNSLYEKKKYRSFFGKLW